MKMFLIVISLVVSAVVIIPTTACSSQPSKEETVQFIDSKMNKNIKNRWLTASFTFREESNCVYSITEDMTSFEDGRVVRKTYLHVKKIDPLTIKVTRYSDHDMISFNAPDLNPMYSIKKIYYGYQGKGTSSNPVEGKTEMYRGSNDINDTVIRDFSVNGEKVAKAFKHIVELCGGAKELF